MITTPILTTAIARLCVVLRELGIDHEANVIEDVMGADVLLEAAPRIRERAQPVFGETAARGQHADLAAVASEWIGVAVERWGRGDLAGADAVALAALRLLAWPEAQAVLVEAETVVADQAVFEVLRRLPVLDEAVQAHRKAMGQPIHGYPSGDTGAAQNPADPPPEDGASSHKPKLAQFGNFSRNGEECAALDAVDSLSAEDKAELDRIGRMSSEEIDAELRSEGVDVEAFTARIRVAAEKARVVVAGGCFKCGGEPYESKAHVVAKARGMKLRPVCARCALENLEKALAGVEPAEDGEEHGEADARTMAGLPPREPLVIAAPTLLSRTKAGNIARKLSPAQRRALRWCATGDGGMPSSATIDALHRRDLKPNRSYTPDLTDLGRAVLAELGASLEK